VHPLGIRKKLAALIAQTRFLTYELHYYSSNPFLEIPTIVVIYQQQPARALAINRSLPLICLFV
jgi:hypothetical protein